jgi:putative spermidine/putrescine transport system substrate-binding protein
MAPTLSRRGFLSAAGTAAASIALCEAGRPSVAHAQETFTVSIVGGNFGKAQIKEFITDPDFEKKNNVSISYDFAQDNIRAAKAIASCGNPVFVTVDAQNLQAVMLAEAGCIEDYDLSVVTNYKDIVDAAKEAPRKGLSNFYAPFVILAYGLTYNTKEIPEPTSFEDLMSPKLKGRIAVPSFDWMGPQFLYSANAALGGSDNDLGRGFQFLSDLVKKNGAIVLNNSDSAQQAFTRGEVVAMPFWNGRTNLLAKSGLPVKMVYPKNWVVTGSGHVITKGNKFSKQANLLVNNMLNGDFQMKMGAAFGYPPSNKTAKLSGDIEAMRIPDAAFDVAARLDYGAITNNMASNLARWNKDVLG